MTGLFDFERQFDQPSEPIRNQTSVMEGLVSSFESGFDQTITHSLFKLAELGRAKAVPGPKLSVEQLNQNFPGSPWFEPQNFDTAKLIDDRRKDRQRLAGIVSRGPDSIFYDIGNFIAAMVPHALDPFELASGFAVEGIGLGLVRGTRLGVKFSERANLLRKSMAARSSVRGRDFIRFAAEGALGNLVVEPIAVIANQAELNDYTARDFFISTIGGAIGFGAARQVLGGLGDELLSYAVKSNKPLLEKMFKSSIGRYAAGQNIDLDPYAREMNMKTQGHPETGIKAKLPVDSNYQYKKVTPDELKDRAFFIATSKTKRDLKPSNVINSTIDRGQGTIQLSDNVNTKNGLADGGDIFTATVPEKMIDLDSVLPKPVIDRITKELGNKAPRNMETRIGQDVLNDVRNSIIDNDIPAGSQESLNALFEAEGFKGYLETQSESVGLPHDPHNLVTLFNPKDAKVLGRFRSDPDAIPRITQQEASAITVKGEDPENSLWAQKSEDKAEFEQIRQNPEKDTTPVEFDKKIDEELEDFKQLEEMGIADPEDRILIKKLQEERRLGVQEELAYQRAKVCIGRNVG